MSTLPDTTPTPRHRRWAATPALVASVLWLLATGCVTTTPTGSAPATPSAPAATHPARPKLIFAHYMGCFPAGTGATAYYRDLAHELRHDSKDLVVALGGNVRNWPYLPPNSHLTAEQSADLEIRRALRIGIDGFSVDAWAGTDQAKAALDALFKVAEEKDYPFMLTICLDPSCHPLAQGGEQPARMIAGFADSIRWLLARHGQSPKLARRDGKPLIFGYSSRITPRLAGPEDQDTWPQVIAAYQEVERQVGTPLYFHFAMEHFFMGTDLNKWPGARPPHDPGEWYVKAAAAMAAGFPAVGAFIDRDFTPEQAAMAAAVRAQGAEWQQPVWHQYENMLGSLMVEPGTNLMRERWRLARDTGSTLLQYVTWNDYGEDTNLAPGYHTRYSIYDLTGYYIAWWRQGSPPKVDHDRIYVIYRAYPPAAPVFPFRTRRSEPGVIEVQTLLTHAASITLPGRAAPYDAPAGLFVKQFPLTPGPISVDLRRHGRVVQHLDCPEPISDHPFREDNSMWCWSTEEQRHWQADFGDTPLATFSEYGDDDHNGLPNWYEMYWFGKWLEWSTATGHDAAADPDHDGQSNLAEYLAQTDPTKAPPVYAAGHVWDIEDVPRRGTSFNPDADAAGSPVWHYLFRLGQPPIDAQGAFIPCPIAEPHTSYTGILMHSAPYQLPGYASVYGWIDRLARSDKPADGWRLHLLARTNAMMALGWQSPVAGEVSVQAVLAPLPRSAGARLVVTLGGKVLLERALTKDSAGPLPLPVLTVKPGDRLLFILDGGTSNDRELSFEQLRLTLAPPHGAPRPATPPPPEPHAVP